MSKEHLTFKALCVLDQAVEESRQQPVKGGIGLRFALAFLYAIDRSGDRQRYDDFWRWVQGLNDRPGPQTDYIRGTYACTQLQGICRTVGYYYDVEFAEAMAEARRYRGPIKSEDHICTLYNLKTTRAEIIAYFSATDQWRRDRDKDYVATNRDGFVVAASGGQRSLTAMRWGVPPPIGVKGPVVNVRNLEKGFWRQLLANVSQRCLVPATEFSEWSAEPDPITGKKVLHWFSVPASPIFAFAGIWQATDKGPAFAFLTCAPNPLVAAIHPKAMPVILHPEDYDRWLSADYDEAFSLAQPFPSQLMATTN